MFRTIVMLLCAAALLSVSSCKDKASNKSDGAKVDTSEFANPTKNLYQDMRRHAFATTAESLRINTNPEKLYIYGSIMEWNMGDVTATVIAYETGDASMYLSNGKMYIGGIGQEKVRQAGIDFVEESKKYISKTHQVDSAELPAPKHIRFYMLTNKGKYMYDEPSANFEAKKSEWMDLFIKGNQIITAYRMVDEARK